MNGAIVFRLWIPNHVVGAISHPSIGKGSEGVPLPPVTPLAGVKFRSPSMKMGGRCVYALAFGGTPRIPPKKSATTRTKVSEARERARQAVSGALTPRTAGGVPPWRWALLSGVLLLFQSSEQVREEPPGNQSRPTGKKALLQGATCPLTMTIGATSDAPLATSPGGPFPPGVEEKYLEAGRGRLPPLAPRRRRPRPPTRRPPPLPPRAPAAAAASRA